MADFWNLIVQSNTFNFIVMLVIFAIIWQKLNLSASLVKMKSDIVEFIENSKKERTISEEHLLDAKKSIENLDSEIKEKLEKSKVLAQNVFEEIQTMALKSVEKIEANVDKIIDNETRKINSKLSDSTVDSAVKLATEKLKAMFSQNPELHAQYINKSIEALNRIKL